MTESNQTILIIEDDQFTRELYQRELGRHYPVLACSKEAEALSLLQNHSVCAIILEPAISSGSGWALLKVIHNSPRTSTVPVIVCTTLDERRLGLELGATLCLLKPILPDTLYHAVSQVILSPTAPFNP